MNTAQFVVIKLYAFGRVVGTSLTIAEMLKACAVEGAHHVHDIDENITHSDKIPTNGECHCLPLQGPGRRP